MSEPKRGKHDEYCVMASQNCLCNTCQKDDGSRWEEACCMKMYGMGRGSCPVCDCTHYIKDEPTKKGAAQAALAGKEDESHERSGTDIYAE